MSHEEGNPFHTAPKLWEKLKPLARQKRHNPTPAEDKLWQELRNRHLCGAKFRRQYTVDRFIVDFFCPKTKLIIEVDGPIHDYTQEEDALRQEFLEAQGLKVIRFTNDVVMKEMQTVLAAIADLLQQQIDDK